MGVFILFLAISRGVSYSRYRLDNWEPKSLFISKRGAAQTAARFATTYGPSRMRGVGYKYHCNSRRGLVYKLGLRNNSELSSLFCLDSPLADWRTRRKNVAAPSRSRVSASVPLKRHAPRLSVNAGRVTRAILSSKRLGRKVTARILTTGPNEICRNIQGFYPPNPVVRDHPSKEAEAEALAEANTSEDQQSWSYSRGKHARISSLDSLEISPSFQKPSLELLYSGVLLLCSSLLSHFGLKSRSQLWQNIVKRTYSTFPVRLNLCT